MRICPKAVAPSWDGRSNRVYIPAQSPSTSGRSPGFPGITNTATKHSRREGAKVPYPTIKLRTKSGDRVGIWVDSAGQLVDEPAPPARAIADAALAALGLWLSVAAVAGALLALTRAILIRVRNASWQHDIDSLFCTQR